MKIFFFGRHEGKLETFAKICVAASLETLREYLTVGICDKQVAWKLLSEISRTAPDSSLQAVLNALPVVAINFLCTVIRVVYDVCA